MTFLTIWVAPWVMDKLAMTDCSSLTKSRVHYLLSGMASVWKPFCNSNPPSTSV
jgi:hypothetical protein